MPFPLLIPAIAGGLQGLGKIALGIKQNHEANKIKPVYTPYQESQYAKNFLSTAQNRYYGRSQASVMNDQNIAASQAAAMQNVSRNATDSTQALAMANALQNSTNDAFAAQRAADDQQKFGALSLLGNAYKGMVAEGDKVYQDKFNKFKIDTEQKSALRQSGLSNLFGAVEDIGGGIMSSYKLGAFKK